MRISESSLWVLGKVKSVLYSANQSAICSVAPTGDVDSKITKSPFLSTEAMALAAAWMYLRSGWGISSLFSVGKKGVGTAIKNASATSGVKTALSFPSLTALWTIASKSGSTMWISPRLMVSTACWLTSTPITFLPYAANIAAVGRPM